MVESITKMAHYAFLAVLFMAIAAIAGFEGYRDGVRESACRAEVVKFHRCDNPDDVIELQAKGHAKVRCVGYYVEMKYPHLNEPVYLKLDGSVTEQRHTGIPDFLAK